ncbi:MAG: ferrochelatase [Microscillaceae bacterium]|nr:ferrochelatase [Microscillaceae bacterium]MDW8459889.1 ferrochelatase [Cytophagales bacterium]
MNTTSPRIGVLLVNLGTPDSYRTSDVRKYLREFLMDKRVIDIPFIPRWLLVNLIIAPFRAPKSAKVYKKVWTKHGSPLKYYGYRIKEMLQGSLGNNFIVELAMRYQSPSIKEALQTLRKKQIHKIIVIPLFPQYASATTGSVHQKVMDIVRKWQIIPEISFVQSFFDHPQFIEAFANVAQKYLQERPPYDHFIFSYHGLPERQIRKGDDTKTCLVEAQKNPEKRNEANCCATIHNGNRTCYRAQCFATTRLLAKRLGIAETDYTVAFQSRLGNDPWIRPYTDEIIKQLVKQGKKRILAFSPSFVADCLETTIEIGEEYKEVFEKHGGEHWQLVESLNDNALWIETLKSLVLQNVPVATSSYVANLIA